MSGWKEWQIGEVVEASDFQTYVQNQVVQVYADSAARTTALGTAVSEGMVAYLQDTNSTEVYNGSSWVAVGAGDITSVTAGTGLTGGGTSGDVTLNANLAAIGSALALTTGTSGYTALSAGTAGISYQPVSHNYIINGAFDVWQRGTSFVNPAAGAYSSDRWLNFISGGTRTISRQTFTPAELNVAGFGDAKTYLRWDCGTSGANVLKTLIEDVQTLAGQTVTLSFWAKASASRTIAINWYQQFGSGGSGSATGTVTGSQAIGTSWARYSYTFALSSISGKTIGTSSHLQLDFDLSSATGTFDIWGVQLEAGSVATPFKRNANSLQGEEAACERYYQEIAASASNSGAVIAFGMARSTTRVSAIVPVVTTMRSQPSVSFVSQTAFRVWDGVNAAPTTTAMTVDAVSYTENGGFTVNADVASGLTQYRPYSVIPAAATRAVIALSSEL